jgi:hypothetical protein
MAQKFWMRKQYANLPNQSFWESVEISIPDLCIHCSNPITIADIGHDHSPSTVSNSCEHIKFYAQIYDMRIQENEPTVSLSVKVSNNIPLSCAKCGDFHDYAVANQKDGSFVCYQCRH